VLKLPLYVCIVVLFWCPMQCWVRWIDFNIGKGKKKESWKRISAGHGCIPTHRKISSNLGKCKGYIWVVAKLSIQAKGIYDLQKNINPSNGYIWFAKSYQSRQWVYMICKKLLIRAMGIYDLQNIINPGNGYIWFASRHMG
jgi:hypothetical protein